MMCCDGLIALAHGLFAGFAYAFHRPVWLQGYSAFWFFVCGCMAYKFYCKIRRRG